VIEELQKFLLGINSAKQAPLRQFTCHQKSGALPYALQLSATEIEVEVPYPVYTLVATVAADEKSFWLGQIQEGVLLGDEKIKVKWLDVDKSKKIHTYLFTDIVVDMPVSTILCTTKLNDNLFLLSAERKKINDLLLKYQNSKK